LPDGVALVAVAGLSTGSSFRTGGLCAEQVDQLAELGGAWPPILVRPDGFVVDGAHRVAAARRLGLVRVPAECFEGGPEDAFVEFVRRNVAHGLMLTLSERKQAAVRVLRVHPSWSDRRVAELCALSPKTVGRLRLKAVCPTEDGLQPDGDTEVREGRDHRLRPVRRGSVRGRVVEALRAQPGASLRTIASAVGVSPETVRLVRMNLATDPGDRAAEAPVTAPVAALVEGLAPTVDGVVWRSDAALESSERGADLLSWLDRTAVDPSDLGWAEVVPLSRVYLVAEEARRRSEAWLRLADALEARPARTQ
jgi:ParB-like chromosome segregation protein Spo0J